MHTFFFLPILVKRTSKPGKLSKANQLEKEQAAPGAFLAGIITKVLSAFQASSSTL